MIHVRLVKRRVFEVIGRKTWISEQDSSLFTRFWERCRDEGTLDALMRLSAGKAGPQTGGVLLGVSLVERDPSNRSFEFMIGIERPEEVDAPDLVRHTVPAGLWAVFACRGPIPEALVLSEVYAFQDWLPASGYAHASASEMEVYPPGDEDYCEFWLPIQAKA